MKKNFRVIALAALFLIPAGISSYSPLADLIGYIMITAALSMLCRLEERISEARKRFLILVGVSGVRYVLSVVYPDLSQTTELLFALCFAVTETILVLPAFAKLLSGTEYLLARHSEKSCDAVTDSLKKLTSATFLIKALAIFMPLLPQLSGREGSTVYTNEESAFSDFTNLYFIFAGIVLLAVGLPWTVKFIKTYFRISGDGDFLKSIREKYEKEVLSFPGRLIASRMKTVLTLIIVGSAFLFNFYTDNVNVFPNFISAGIFAVCFIMMTEAPAAFRYTGLGSCIGWAVMSFVSLRLQIGFDRENYTPEWALHGIGKSAQMYKRMEIVSYIEALFFAVSVLLLIICLVKAVKSHMALNEKYSELRRPLLLSIGVYAAFSALAVIINAAETPVMKYYPLIWMINAAIVAALVISAYKMSANLHEKLYYRIAE